MPVPLTRRKFILQAAAGSTAMIGLGSGLGGLEHQALPAKTSFYEKLLARWCHALAAHQIHEIKTPGIHGGILCPLCSRIHGRSADAIQPFLYMAHATGRERYLQAAISLQAWSNHVSRSDGSWVNETVGNEWKGITVGGVLALAESLRHHGSLLDPAIRRSWEQRMAKGARFIYDFIRLESGNINYPISAAAALAAVDRLMDEPRYRARAKELAHGSLAFITPENKLLFGEGNPPRGRSPRQCRAVDLGYNVEESLPNFALYATLTGDAEVRGPLVETLRAHLEFMLPDGAWDNSWGTRNFKWSYWGTRTGDGCQAAFALMAKEDPRFAAAALRNAELLDRCTHQGLLQGGPHFIQQGELPCIHHTFCHARGLATVLEHGLPPARPGVELPRDLPSGVREFPEILTSLAGIGPWRATVTAYDWVYDPVGLPAGHASGGALSVLWHSGFGPVFLASVTEYNLVEASNMQPPRDGMPAPLTPRIEVQTAAGLFSSLHDLDAQVRHQATAECIAFEVHGTLKDRNQKPLDGVNPFRMHYELKPQDVIIKAQVQPGASSVQLRLPLICSKAEQVRRLDGGLEILKRGVRLRVTWSAPERGVDIEARAFHPVPGFQALPLSWELPRDGQSLVIHLQVIG